MIFKALPLQGPLLIEPPIFEDFRGTFVKNFHNDLWKNAGINFMSAEEFYSVSHRNVLRGMHFQIPPHDHAKVVTCMRGAVLDVLLDLRKSSPTFGRATGVELSSLNRRILYIPSGFAHGFLSREDETIMHYKVTSVHSPLSDRGIRWDSFGFEWNTIDPMISARDSSFPSLENYESPFS